MQPTTNLLVEWFSRRGVLLVLIYCLASYNTPSVSSSALNSLRSLLTVTSNVKEVVVIKEGVRKNPIVFIPGDGGSQLEARLDKSSVPHYFCSKVSDWFDLWLNIHLLVPGAIDCMFDNFMLHYDNKTRKTHNTEGVEIRPTNFGSLESVDYLDILKVMGTDYFHNIITTLKDRNGYEANVDMVGAGFDFRKAPNELAEYFVALKNLIEAHYVRNGYQPVTLICHSMGCLNSFYLLNKQTENWKEVYVKRLISLAAPWSGSFKAISAMLYGDNLGIPLLDKNKLQRLQSTFPSLMYLFPREPAFDKSRILIETPTSNYTLANLDQLFLDANLLEAREMWHDTRTIASNLKPPNVELWCLYGNLTKKGTPSKVIYSESLVKNKYTEIQGSGDGTVNLESLSFCETFGALQKKPVYTRMFQGVDHISILRGPEAANFISTQISVTTC